MSCSLNVSRIVTYWRRPRRSFSTTHLARLSGSSYGYATKSFVAKRTARTSSTVKSRGRCLITALMEEPRSETEAGEWGTPSATMPFDNAPERPPVGAQRLLKSSPRVNSKLAADEYLTHLIALLFAFKSDELAKLLL